MPKYINADEMLKEESEAYMSAQANIADIETYVLNHLVHAKIIRLLHDAPAADVQEVRHAKWKCYGDCGVTRCSACDWSIDEYVEYRYCPNCGARMDASEKA
mgnify:CR=1 FL=1